MAPRFFATALIVASVLVSSLAHAAEKKTGVLTVCNDDPDKELAVALVHHPAPESSLWQLSGWLSVSANSCEPLHDIPVGYVHIFATYDGEANILLNDQPTSSFCVTPDILMERFVGDNRDCNDHERLVLFASYFFSGDLEL